MKSVYIHIPFCQQICHYCDFNKFFIQRQPVDEYIESLRFEMEHELQTNDEKIETIYIGGGTPTALTPVQLETLLRYVKQYIPYDETIEYTVEANPGDLTKEKLQILKQWGVNRLSLGVQTFSDVLLEKLGRLHREQDIYDTIALAKEVGFTNINVDLMYAIPYQTMDDWRDTLQKAMNLGVQHFSAYSLILEPKTVYYIQHQRGKLTLLPEELEADMFRVAMDVMEEHGYKQYEISNFSKDGCESRHNLTYWNNEYYYGLGAGAHGYIDGKRTQNHGPLQAYMKNVSEQGNGIREEHRVTKEEAMEEELFLGLRKIKGVSREHFFEKFSLQIEDVFAEQLKETMKDGLLQYKDEFYSLTEQGKFLGNEVFSQFLL